MLHYHMDQSPHDLPEQFAGLDPQEMVEQAAKEATEQISAIDRTASPFERVGAERDAVEHAVRVFAIADDGGANPDIRPYMTTIGDVSSNYTKTDVQNSFDDAVETLTDEKNASNPRKAPLDVYIENSLDEVKVVRSSDAKQATLYRWHFEGDVKFETGTTHDGRTHFSWPAFRDEIHDASGIDPSRPQVHRRDGEDWRNFIVDVVHERKAEIETKGPRTDAVERLQNKISRSTAYGQKDHALTYGGVFLDDDPEEGDPSELWVQSGHVSQICDTAELESLRALQVELDARGHTLESVNGVSKTTTVNGQLTTFWVLSPDFADPFEYVETPGAAADIAAAEDAAADGEGEDIDDEPGLDYDTDY